jgi:hypothetical protein
MQKTKERGQAAFKLKACARINSLAAWLALPAPLHKIQYLDHEPSGLLWGLGPGGSRVYFFGRNHPRFRAYVCRRPAQRIVRHGLRRIMDTRFARAANKAAIPARHRDPVLVLAIGTEPRK